MRRPQFDRCRNPVRALLLVLLLVGCSAPADHPALKQAQLPPLIQAHRFAYRPALQRDYQLSPDGRKLAWVGSHWLRGALFVRDNDSGVVRRYAMMSGTPRWTADSRRLLSTGTDTSGAENTHVYMLDTEDPAASVVDLTPYPGVRATLQRMPFSNAQEVLVYHNRRDPKLFDLYRIDLATRKETLVAQNPGDAVAPITARDGSLRGWQQARDAQRPVAEKLRPRAVRQPDLVKDPDDTFRVVGRSADNGTLWVLSNRGRDRIALLALDPKTRWEKIVFEDPQVDVNKVTLSRVSGNPLLAHTQPGLPRTEILDEALRADLDALLKAQGSEPFALDIVSTDATEQRMVISVSAFAAQRYYLLDRARHTHALLAENAAVAAEALPPVQPVTITSRDGLPLHGYLTLPRGIKAQGLPLVLVVHGGPWLRTGSPFDSEDANNAQFLANRGYAVLQVDFRGSTGYGKQFLAAAIGEFAGAMHEDLLDAVRWAVTSSIADAQRVAIMGWSYGGYAAMVGLTMTPRTFACGISLSGPTDLASLIEAFPPYWKTDLSMWHDYVGNPALEQDRAEMTQLSPLTHAAKLEHPLLIVHGAKDVRVRIDQSQRMVEALRRAGKPVEFVPIADMGHGASWWVHRLLFLRKTEDFLQRCLGGRASRFDPVEPVARVWHRISRQTGK